jgi:predicted transcriptional regulator
VASETTQTETLKLATELTIAWLSNPNTRAGAEDVPAYLKRIYATLGVTSEPAQVDDAATAGNFTPAVSVRKSLASKDHIISLIDGKPYKTLRRHLSRHGLTPEQYRKRYRLKPDYPMVSENYTQMRRDMAIRIGLGRHRTAGSITSANTKPE